VGTVHWGGNTSVGVGTVHWGGNSSHPSGGGNSTLGWEQYRYALGHHRRNHPKSPFDEREADRIDQITRNLHHLSRTQQDQNGCPVLNSPLLDPEILRHLKITPPDKSPGVDGISNRMLQAGGPQFQKTLCL